MATGTIKWFAQGLLDLGNKVHNLSVDTFKLGIVTNATVPLITTASPHWSGTGTTNFATNQVSTGGTQYTGPITLSSVSWSIVSGIPTFRAADISLTLDASGFTNGAYGIIYNNSDSFRRAIGYLELNASGSLSLQSASLYINWGGAGNDVFYITAS